MKLAIARSLLSLMLLPAATVHGQSATNAYAYAYFLAPDGNLALVDIVQTQDPTTQLVTTELFYTFCGQAELGLSCAQGDGLIPNSAVTGTVLQALSKTDVMSVKVDTSTVAGYTNQICTQGIDYNGDCLGLTPTTGGIISISWTRTNAWANVDTSTNKQYQLGKQTSSNTSLLEVFSANMNGTVLGVPAVNNGGAVMTTSTDSQTLQQKFASMNAKRK